MFTAVSALFFLLCGCQFIPNDEVARFGTDRKFPNLNFYTGDGNFKDYGRKAGIFRFVLDLGAVNLTEASVSKFELKGLPKVEFVCYLRIDHPLPTIGKPKDFEAEDLVVEMSLEDEMGTKVFSEKAPLKIGLGQVLWEHPKVTFIPARPYSLLRKTSLTGSPSKSVKETNTPKPNYCSWAEVGKHSKRKLDKLNDTTRQTRTRQDIKIIGEFLMWWGLISFASWGWSQDEIFYPLWIIGTIAFFWVGFLKDYKPSQTFSDDGIGGVLRLIWYFKCHYMLGFIASLMALKTHSFSNYA